MDNEKKYLFDNPQNIKRILHLLYGSCVLLFLLDFVIHRHVLHSWGKPMGLLPCLWFCWLRRPGAHRQMDAHFPHAWGRLL